ncbi:hypothetical protein ACIPJS_02370 [Streptomyces sp. NPDC086783]|uniref:hypothetical protein n=1 Tax=Streptomyces sp. NPDC086783 TaxID=3365758 RepID=UPI00381544C6
MSTHDAQRTERACSTERVAVVRVHGRGLPDDPNYRVAHLGQTGSTPVAWPRPDRLDALAGPGERPAAVTARNRIRPAPPGTAPEQEQTVPGRSFGGPPARILTGHGPSTADATPLSWRARAVPALLGTAARTGRAPCPPHRAVRRASGSALGPGPRRTPSTPAVPR